MNGLQKVAITISAGLVGFGCIALFLLMSSSEWGAPGTEAYFIYEARNRLIPFLLILIALGIVAAYLTLRSNLGRLGHLSFIISVSGAALMLVGNVSEFWFFSSQPYGQVNARLVAWFSFLLGGLLLVVGLAIFMAAATRTKGAQ